MRIISSFNDYYDCIQRHGQESDLIYIRETKGIVEDKPPYDKDWENRHFSWCNSYWGGHFSVTDYYVGFCGKIHYVLKLQCPSDNTRPYLYDNLTWAYSIEDVDKFILQIKRRYQKEYHTKHKSRHMWRWSHALHRDAIKDRFEKYKDFSQTKILEGYFEKYNCPMFKWHSHNVMTINPSLKDIGFQRVVDTYTAYQEISMYLGNFLDSGNNHKTKYAGKPMSDEVSDKDMITAKGFDKFSFKKEPKK